MDVGYLPEIANCVEALQELHKSMPDSLKDHSLNDRTTEQFKANLSGEALLHSGRSFLSDVYGTESGRNIEHALGTLSPRLGYYSVSLVYGGIYSDTSALSIRDVSPPIKDLVQMLMK